MKWGEVLSVDNEGLGNYCKVERRDLDLDFSKGQILVLGVHSQFLVKISKSVVE